MSDRRTRRVNSAALACASVLIAAITLTAAHAASTPGTARPVKVLTFNLHGYHPTNESERWLEDPSGRRSKADSYLFFFAQDELDRGHRLRLDLLAQDLEKIAPDLVFLQEVAAGGPQTSKTCEEYYRKPSSRSDDRPELNSALRLLNRLSAHTDYRAALACRGNIGWWTDGRTFKDQRVIRVRDSGVPEVIFDFGANPYPSGLLVEGLAMLVRAPLSVLDEQHWRVPTAIEGDQGYAQAAVIQLDHRLPASPWIIAVNIHGARKLRHFEQAVRIRRMIHQYYSSVIRTLRPTGRFGGVIVGGDFNAQVTELSTAPWSMDHSGRDNLKWPLEPQKLESLKTELLRFNFNQTVDEDATIRAPAEAELRAQSAIDHLLAFSQEWGAPRETAAPWGLHESLVWANSGKLCAPPATLQATCNFKNRIDLLFASPGLKPSNSYVIYSQNDWIKLQSLSDHPGLVSEFVVSR